MKRYLGAITLVTILGFAVNVAVAWAIAIWTPAMPHRGSSMSVLPSSEIATLWSRFAPKEWPSAPQEAIHLRAFGKSALDIPASPQSVGAQGHLLHVLLSRQRYGWPANSLQSVHLIAISDAPVWPAPSASASTTTAAHIDSFGSLPLPDWLVLPASSQDRLPFAPVWSGLAINTILYSLFFWLFAAGFPLVRRRLRLRRGLCPKCCYPRGASDECPECGASFTTAQRHVA